MSRRWIVACNVEDVLDEARCCVSIPAEGGPKAWGMSQLAQAEPGDIEHLFSNPGILKLPEPANIGPQPREANLYLLPPTG